MLRWHNFCIGLVLVQGNINDDDLLPVLLKEAVNCNISRRL